EQELCTEIDSRNPFRARLPGASHHDAEQNCEHQRLDIGMSESALLHPLHADRNHRDRDADNGAGQGGAEMRSDRPPSLFLLGYVFVLSVWSVTGGRSAV